MVGWAVERPRRGAPGHRDDPGPARRFSSLVDDYDVIDVLDRLVARSVALLAADTAGIMLADARGQLRVVASSSEESDSTELLSVGDYGRRHRARRYPRTARLGRGSTRARMR